jgi:CHAT domain
VRPQPLHLTINARRIDRITQSDHEGEIFYEFFANGVFLGRSVVDLATKRTLLLRLHALTADTEKNDWTDASEESLRRIGHQLFALFVPQEVQRLISEHPTAAAIVLEVQDHDIPWELLHDEQDFIGNRLSLGRKTMRPDREGPPQGRARLRALIVGDPRGDLPSSAKEANALEESITEALRRLSQRFNFDYEVRVLIGETATKAEVVLDGLLDPEQPFDIFHFAGHAHLDTSDPDRTALELADSELRAFEVRRLTSTPMVFVNACKAGFSQEELSPAFGAISGFAADFMAGGASSYVAPLWAVRDDIARDVAVEVYEALIEGETVGQAILRGKHSRSHPDCLAYVLFGDPNGRLAVFSPSLTSGPFVNEAGIEHIIELEREYSSLELLAVNELPWVLWDETDISGWIARLPIDADRQLRCEQLLQQYTEDFGSRIRHEQRYLVAVVNGSALREYFARRGVGRLDAVTEAIESFSESRTFAIVLDHHSVGEIEEIELVSQSAQLPPDPASTVYVFNKQTRFEHSALTYNLYEDFSRDMVLQYSARFNSLLSSALRGERLTSSDGRFDPALMARANAATLQNLRLLRAEMFPST